MNDSRTRLVEICDGSRTYRQLASELGLSICYIQELVKELGLQKPPRDLSNKRTRSPEALLLIEKIKDLCDGSRSSSEIASQLGCNTKYVQRIMKEFDLPRLPPHSPMESVTLPIREVGE